MLTKLATAGIRDGPPPSSRTAAGAEQPAALPGITVRRCPGAQAVGDVRPAAALRPRGEHPPPSSRFRFDWPDALWQDRREMREVFIRAVPSKSRSLNQPSPRAGAMLSTLLWLQRNYIDAIMTRWAVCTEKTSRPQLFPWKSMLCVLGFGCLSVSGLANAGPIVPRPGTTISYQIQITPHP